MTALQAAILSIWLTGMVPILAADACGVFAEPSWRERLFIYAAWPLVPWLIVIAVNWAAAQEENER